MTRPPALTPRRQRVLVCCTLVLAALAATPARAATAEDRYTAALAHERELRTPRDQPASLEQVRNAIAAYEAIVRQFPDSGYSDNALWQAAGLALHAFDYHRQPADRDTAARLLGHLETAYPSSSFVPRVTARLEEIRGLDAPVRLRAIRREPLADLVRVTIELDDEVPYHAERLDGPARLFFDFSGTYAPPPLRDATLGFDDGDLVRQIRLGRHPGQTTRVVLDIEDVDRFSVYTLYNPYRLVVDTVPTASRQARRGTAGSPTPPPASDDAGPAPAVRANTTASQEPADAGHRASDATPPPGTSPGEPAPIVLPVPRGWDARRLDEVPPVYGLVPAAQVIPVSMVNGPPHAGHAPPAALGAPVSDRTEATAPEPAPAWFPDLPEPSPGAGSLANSDGAFSLARQLGLGVSRIVIDPGHGGHDPGAQAGELTESALVLDVARRLEARLLAATDIEVVLTRRRDAFLPLRARTELANRVHADIFLSIHANAAADHRTRGIETYYLDLATDPASETVAARENAAARGGMHDLPQLVEAITMYSKLDESRDFAGMVQRNLISGVRELHPEAVDLGVKQAPFAVLIGANMPSVLAEISFLTNQTDAAFLTTDAYRDRIADALLESILEYQQALKPPASFAANTEDD